jgi:hypothetical protein
MKKKIESFGMLAILLALGFVMFGCKSCNQDFECKRTLDNGIVTSETHCDNSGCAVNANSGSGNCTCN